MIYGGGCLTAVWCAEILNAVIRCSCPPLNPHPSKLPLAHHHAACSESGKSTSAPNNVLNISYFQLGKFAAGFLVVAKATSLTLLHVGLGVVCSLHVSSAQEVPRNSLSKCSEEIS